MCESCVYRVIDELTGEELCSIESMMDEDDLARIHFSDNKCCPYYKVGDEYTIVRKQI